MNEKIFISFGAVVIVLLLVCGAAIGGYISGANHGRSRSADEIAELNRRYDSLNREYTDRQREIETGIKRCLVIIERTDANTSTAVSNLRAAVEYIKQGIAERENLKMELDNIRAGLRGSRDMAWVQNNEVRN